MKKKCIILWGLIFILCFPASGLCLTALEYAEKGSEFSDQRNFGSAIEMFTKAIKMDGKDAAFYINRGFAYYQNGKYIHALSDYNKAVKLSPRDESAYNGREIGRAHV